MQCRGYTLTELLIVVSLIALAASVAIPSLEPIERTKLDHVTAHLRRNAALRAKRVDAHRRFARPIARRRRFEDSRLPHRRRDAGLRRLSPYRQTASRQTLRSAAVHLRRHDADEHHRFAARATTLPPLQFDANGSAWCRDPANVFVERATTVPQRGRGYHLEINLDGLTGRVTSP